MSSTDLTGEAQWMPDVYAQPEPEHHEHREVRVIGPPGCGKTTYLATQARDVAVPKYGAHNIVICSLTKAAAAEIGGRDTGIPRENVGTLHAHAYRALERPLLAETAERLNLWNEQCDSGHRIDPRMASDPENAPSEAFDGLENTGGQLLQAVGLRRQRMSDPAAWPRELRVFHDAWETWKADNQLLDFTDLIANALRDIQRHPANPRVIMADEAQDMSRLEMALLRQWGQYADTLVIVGDPDQALYTWRGADPREVFGTDRSQVLVREQGYRVPEAVRAFAQDLIQRIPDRLDVTYLPRVDEAGEPVQGSVTRLPSTIREELVVANELIREAQDGTVMLLASCGYMLEPVIACLRGKGIPFHNPYRTKHGRWNPLDRQSRLLAYLRPSPDVYDDPRLWTWRELKRWVDPLKAQGLLVRGVKTQIDHRTAPDHFGDTAAADELVTLEYVRGMFLNEDDAVHACSLNVQWWLDHLRHDDQKRQRYPIAVYRNQGGRALTDTPNIIVGTIHSVKGGEADVVYLSPDLSRAGKNAYDMPGEPRNSVIRQMYVGVTRAKQHLRLLKPSGEEAVDL